MLNIRLIEQPEHRFTTIGDWWENPDGTFEVRVTRMNNIKHTMMVLLHEISEWAICQATGVSTKLCDEFDALWEDEIDRGLHAVEEEAGFDVRCPYRAGHIFGCGVEHIMCVVLNASWEAYEAECNELLHA